MLRRFGLLYLVAMILAGCGESGPPTAPGTLNVLLPADAIDPEIIEQFERITGDTVAIDTYADADAVVARMRDRPAHRRYDLLVAPRRKRAELVEQGLVQPLDEARLDNARHVAERFRESAGGQAASSLPYQWGTVGILYRTDRVDAFEPTWAMFFDPSRRPGPFVLLDDPRLTLGAALRHLGHSINTTDPELVRAAGEQVLAAKGHEQCLGLMDAGAAVGRVASGEAVMTMASSRDAQRAMAEHENLAYAVPEEGGAMWVDAMFLPAGAEDVELALRFMDYLLDPQIAAQLSNWTHWGTPNEAALPYIEPEQRADPAIYPPDAVMRGFEPVRELGDASAVYEEVWATIAAE